jgi:GT2 family glycosyltransferase
MFSIIIPTWNNLNYLKLAINSINTNSKHQHQIILHVNDGSDGTLSYVQQLSAQYTNIQFTNSSENIGICYAVNLAASIATQKYIVYLNDDMVVLPEWDVNLLKFAHQIEQNTNMFMLSGTMIEHAQSKNKCNIIANYGNNIQNFEYDRLLNDIKEGKCTKNDWLGSTWPPTLVPTELWHKVGGYSIEFSPGMSSDNDFTMKLWHAGCRIFVGVGDSLVYHFGCISTNKIKRNNGRKMFMHKWGITQKDFDTLFINRGKTISRADALHELDSNILQSSHFKLARIKARLKMIFS